MFFLLWEGGERDISELNSKKPVAQVHLDHNLFCFFSLCSIVMSSVLLIVLIIICGQVLQWEFCKTPFWISAQTVIGQVPFLSLQNKDLEGKLLLWAAGTYLLACFHKLPIHLFLWSLNPCAQRLEFKRLHSPNGRCIFPTICITLLCFYHSFVLKLKL